MDMCMIPEGYKSLLSVQETERAIKYVKDTFEHTFADAMRLLRISAPLFVSTDSGLNDNLNGVERPVSFEIKNMKAKTSKSCIRWPNGSVRRLRCTAFPCTRACIPI